MSGILTINLYGQDRLVMDWNGLLDPFVQQIPIKVTNNWSGQIWIQGQLNSPPSRYSSYSGVSLSGVAAGANATIVMTWSTGVSGFATTSSPVSESLTIGLLAFTSSNYTGSLSSGSFAITNTTFDRFSGLIKLFGDIYNNDQPTPSNVLTAAGTLNNSGTYSYAVSYNLSGWESDIGAIITQTMNSGFGTNSLSWSSITGASQYFLWRFSGSSDYTLYSGTSAPNGGMLRPMDLIAAQATTSFTDSGVAALQANMFRHRTWQTYQGSGTADGANATSDTGVFLTSPSSRKFGGGGTNVTLRAAHGYQLNKNLSGTSLTGPFYAIFHERPAQGGSLIAIALQTGVDGSASGTTIADTNALTNQLSGIWYRHAIVASTSGAGLSASGTIHLQLYGNQQFAVNVDDVFLVAVS